MPSPVALLDDGRTEGRQAAQAGRLGVDVAQRLDLIAFIVQQLKMPEPAALYTSSTRSRCPSRKSARFDRLDDRRLALVVCHLQVFHQVHVAQSQAVLSHQAVDCREPLHEPVVRLTSAKIEAEGRTDGR